MQSTKAQPKTLSDVILRGIIEQIQTTMINDKSPLTPQGLQELIDNLRLANSLID